MDAAQVHTSLVSVMSDELKLVTGYNDFLDNLESFSNVWTNNMAGLSIEPLSIQWSDDLPTYFPCYQHKPNPNMEHALRKEFDYLVNTGFLVQSRGKLRCPMLYVPKKTEPFIRIAVDFRQANKWQLLRDLPVPIIRHVIGKLQRFSIYAELDAERFYHQIPITEKDSEILSIATPFGVYRSKFLFEGVASATDMEIRAMDLIFSANTDFEDWLVIAHDGLLIGATDMEDLMDKTLKIIAQASQFNLVININKSTTLELHTTVGGATSHTVIKKENDINY